MRAGWSALPIERLGIPAIKMADGPMGVRSWVGSSAITSAPGAKQIFSSTSFPAGIAMAATWDTDLVQREGQAIAQEVKALGRDMILGPTVNINRVPLWGRNFEGYGEDPYLAARMGVAYIKGVQGEGVIPSVKHFAANNEEFERHRIDAKHRRAHAARDLPARLQSRRAGSRSVDRDVGLQQGERHVLRRERIPAHRRSEEGVRLQGLCDLRLGQHLQHRATVNAGMDLEMPGGEVARKWLQTDRTIKAGNGGDWLVAEKVSAEIKAGHISPRTSTTTSSRILRVIFLSGQFDHPQRAPAPMDTPEQRAVARRAATEGIVLLKNAGELLPLDPAKIKSIAVIGPNAAVARTGGGGSSLVRPTSAVTPLDGIKESAGARVQVTYALGVQESRAKIRKTIRPKLASNCGRKQWPLAAKADAAIVVVGDSSCYRIRVFRSQDSRSARRPGRADPGSREGQSQYQSSSSTRAVR